MSDDPAASDPDSTPHVSPNDGVRGHRGGHGGDHDGDWAERPDISRPEPSPPEPSPPEPSPPELSPPELSPPELSRAEKYRLARRKVEALTALYIHTAVFVGVMALLFVIDAALGGPWWVQWPLLGWGLGLAGHWALVAGDGLSFVSRWQDRKARELMDKM